MADVPKPDDVRKAIASSKDGADGRVMKVLYLNEEGEKVGEYAPTQLPDNPWDGLQAKPLVEPPYNLSQLVFLSEMHPVHSSALDQKVADTVGTGWEWVPRDEDKEEAQDAPERDAIAAWFEGLAPDEFDMREVLEALWLDYETTGWCMFECARDSQGRVQRVYHVPAHTVKPHKNGFALCQARDSRKVWFRRWGSTTATGEDIQINRDSGAVAKGNLDPDKQAADLFVIRKPSRRSSYYGIPGYVSAMGWITLALAARDDNLMFFSNRREPRWAIILTGMSENTEIEEDLRRAFAVDLRSPYRNVIIPITGKDAKVDFQEMSGTAKNEGSFEKLSDRADKAIMIGHRVPAERLANSEVGALGGNIASEANRVYKEAVVGPAQELLNSRLNKFIATEYPKKDGAGAAVATQGPAGAENSVELGWQIKMLDLDIRTDREDLDQALMAFHGNLKTLREARAELGLGPLMVPKKVPKIDPATGTAEVNPLTGEPVMTAAPDDGTTPAEEVESEFNDMLFTELPGAAGAAGSPGRAIVGTGGLESTSKAQRLQENVYELLRSAKLTHARLAEMADGGS